MSAQKEFGLGIGETSAIILAQDVNASLVLIDEIKARKVAREYGMAMLVAWAYFRMRSACICSLT